MVNIDELNKDIEKFGIVIEKVEKLPDTYQDVKEQFEILKKNTDELTELIQSQEKYNKQYETKIKTIADDTLTKLEEIQNNTIGKLQSIDENAGLKLQSVEQNAEAKLQSVEKNAETKLEKTEMSIRERVALLESNITISLNQLKSLCENEFTKINDKMDKESAITKKRFIITTVGIGVIVLLEIILLAASFGAFK